MIITWMHTFSALLSLAIKEYIEPDLLVVAKFHILLDESWFQKH